MDTDYYLIVWAVSVVGDQNKHRRQGRRRGGARAPPSLSDPYFVGMSVVVVVVVVVEGICVAVRDIPNRSASSLRWW